MPMSATIFGRQGVPVRRVDEYRWSDFDFIPNEKVVDVVLMGGPMVVDLPLSDVMVSPSHYHYVNGEDVPCDWLKHCPSYCNHTDVERCIDFIEGA